ncbi:MAG: hypothetical protein JWQ87_4763 [Candidatus Sulfotelmatobacter sp.]|nr:hypothetical protein [Candidatus Sulfotelmatobacter sp.]
MIQRLAIVVAVLGGVAFGSLSLYAHLLNERAETMVRTGFTAEVAVECWRDGTEAQPVSRCADDRLFISRTDFGRPRRTAANFDSVT